MLAWPVVGLPGWSQAQEVAQADAGQATRFSIAAQPLKSAIAVFSRTTGWQVGYSSNIAGVQTRAVSGTMTAGQALQVMLEGTGVQIQVTGPASAALVDAAAAATVNPAVDGALVLDTIDVQGGGTAVGWDGSAATVYTTPGPVSYITGQEIERYQGSSPADIFRSAPGVLSGESRNSGGVDVNIRGLQGMGRVAVTIDGAQNANSAYRGYQGISNRSYLDPDFIGGIAIEKGPSISASGASAIGGLVAISTVGVGDILSDGATQGFRYRLGGGTNTSPVSPNFSNPSEGVYDNGNFVILNPGDRPDLLDPTSVNGSLVYAGTSENLDVVLGFARRRAGNYHAGTRGDGVPEQIDCDDDAGLTCGYDWYSPGLTPYMPGEEVLNTSVDTYSGLGKATLRFGDDHSLELGFNRYNSLYGEVNPMNYYKIDQRPMQHALSQAQLDNYTAHYRWDPDSDLWDLKWNFWYSDLASDNPATQAGRQPTTVGSRSSWADSWGTDLSNTSTFATALGEVALQYGAAYISEKTGPDEDARNNIVVREGERWEASTFVNGTWAVQDWLSFNGGLRYHAYETKDNSPGGSADAFKRDAFDYSAGVTVTPLDGLQLYGLYNVAARLPALFETTRGFTNIINLDVNPEQAHNFEFGANLDRQDVFAAGDALGLKVNLFNNTIDDYIARKATPICLYEFNGSCYYWSTELSMTNIARAKFQGVELAANYTLGGFSAELAGTYYSKVEYCRRDEPCRDTSLASDFATNQVPPEYSVSLSLSQKLLADRLMIGGRISAIGPRAIDAETPLVGAAPLIKAIEWEPHVLIDVYANYAITDNLMAYVSVENLTDQYYVDPLSLALIPSPGRTIRFGVTGEFDNAGLVKGGEADLAPLYDWSGAYAGVNVSHAAMSLETDGFRNYISADAYQNRQFLLGSFGVNAGGLQAGYNWQGASGFVVGVEGDIAAGDGGYSTTVDIPGSTFTGEVEWLASARARVGFAVDRLLVYGTAGYAVADIKGEFAWIGSTIDSSALHTGWTVGGGVEYALGRNWSLKAEASFANLSHGSFRHEKPREGTYPEVVEAGFRTTVERATLGLNYRF